MTVHLEFHGAAGTVTGSKVLLASDGHRVLVDCGLFQGLKELRLRNWRHPAFDPRGIEAVLLTHAHIDHIGYLPALVRDGFRGPVYCTEGTAELAEILLLDSARLHEEDAEYASRKGFSKHRPPLPLYTVFDAERAIGRLHPVPFGTEQRIGPLRASFHIAGHILGSSWIDVTVPAGPKLHHLVFSGDLGRTNMPVSTDPVPFAHCDTLILESTYGDRRHEEGLLEDILAEAIGPALKQRGTVLIPSFAVGRSQLVLHLLGKLISSGRIPRIPVHLDSPMAVNVTRVYDGHRGSAEFDADWGNDAEQQPVIQHHSSVEESKRLNDLAGPRIIVSSSGMLTGGRVLHHLLRLAGNPKNLILLPGYQAAGTRGRTLADGGRVVRLHGQDILVRAQVRQLDGFSAHADRQELVGWVQAGADRPETVFLVHGEEDARGELSRALGAAGYRTLQPRHGERFELTTSGTWRSVGVS